MRGMRRLVSSAAIRAARLKKFVVFPTRVWVLNSGPRPSAGRRIAALKPKHHNRLPVEL